MIKHKKNIKKVLSSKVKNIIWIVIILIALVLGIGVGHSLPTKEVTEPGYKFASSNDIKLAKDDIRNSFKAQSSTDCKDQSDPTSPQAREAVFEKYLKVNKYANRAVIRGCNDDDSLLVKDPYTNKWEKTVVNIALDARANPVWQKECLIDDITLPDSKVRSENSSIDVTNLVSCRILKENDQIVYLQKSIGEKPDRNAVSSQIKGSEDFFNSANYLAK